MSSERNLRQQRLRQLMLATDALVDSMRFSGAGDDIWRFSSYREYMRKYNDLVESGKDLVISDLLVELFDLDKVRFPADMLAMEQKASFDAVFVRAQILRGIIEENLEVREEAATDLRNFLRVNLRRAIFSRPESEKDVQDAVETLLIGRGLERGVDYDRETGRVKVSIKESIPDFVLLKLSLALEIKLTSNASRVKAVVDEMNADIQTYKQAYRRVLFVVYDLGQIRDEAEFKLGIDNALDVQLAVVKH